jgi:hypothetical protein
LQRAGQTKQILGKQCEKASAEGKWLQRAKLRLTVWKGLSCKGKRLQRAGQTKQSLGK